MRRKTLGLFAIVLLLAVSATAQTADEIVAKYVEKIGGSEKLAAIKTLRRTGKFTGGGGFEALMIWENKRPGAVRQEFSLQGLTGITAYDGRSGWKIEPWQGKKDVEPLGETDYYVPLKIETKRMIRGAEIETETLLGDYKEVAGVYFPFSYETGLKNSQNRAKIVFQKIEANVPLDDARFIPPTVKSLASPKKTPEDLNVPNKPIDKSTTDNQKPPAPKPSN